MARPKSARRWALAVGVAVALLVGSLLPVPTGDSGPVVPVGPADLLAHFLGYAALGASLVYATDSEAERDSGWRTLLGLIVIVTLYGAGVELLQGLRPTRAFSVADILANGLGGIVGVWLGDRSLGKTGEREP